MIGQATKIKSDLACDSEDKKTVDKDDKNHNWFGKILW